MPPSSTTVFTYSASDWLDYGKFTPPLTSDVREALEAKQFFRALKLNLKFRIVAETEVDKKKFEASCEKYVANQRTRLRKQASDAFVALVTAFGSDKEKGTSQSKEEKQALELFKKLAEATKKTATYLSSDTREVAARDVGVSADEFYSINEIDYDLRLEPNISADLGETESEQKLEDQNEKLKRRLAEKGKWLQCCLIDFATTGEQRLLVAKAGKEVKIGDAKAEGKLVDEDKTPKKIVGRVFVTGPKLRFEFLSKRKGQEGGKLPGGNSPDAPLKKLIKSLTNKSYSVKVDYVDVYSNKNYKVKDEEPKETAPGGRKSASGSSSDPKSKQTGKLASPIKNRTKSNSD